MSNDKKKIPIPASLVEGQFRTQPEVLMVEKAPNRLRIGIPKERDKYENRVGLTPMSVATLVAHGHEIVIEAGAGDACNFTDIQYSEVGAEVVHDQKKIYEAQVVLRIAPPTLAEIDLMRPNQILISPLQLPMVSVDYLTKLLKKRVIALAMEYIKDDVGSFPVVRIMSEMAGISAIQTAAELLSNSNNGKGVLLGGITGVPPAKVVILGAGVVAEFAIRSAIGLGADVRVLDNNIHKLNRLQYEIGRRLYTSSLNPITLQRQLRTADVVIGAIHSKSGRAPIVVTEDMVMNMKPGSVLIDVSIDQGGCFATSEVTNHHKPTFRKHEVIHYCVPNIASRVARTASIAVSNILTPFLLQAGDTGGVEQLLISHHGLRHGVYAYKGCLTNSYLGKRFNLKATDLDLLITTGFQ